MFSFTRDQSDISFLVYKIVILPVIAVFCNQITRFWSNYIFPDVLTEKNMCMYIFVYMYVSMYEYMYVYTLLFLKLEQEVAACS